MNPLNHFLLPFSILYFIFDVSPAITALFALAFGVLPDLDFITRRYILGRKGKDLRTFIQEPFGILLLGIPVGLLFQYFMGHPYLYMVLIPYVSHVLLDYLVYHKVFPLAPFSHKSMNVGIIPPVYLNIGKYNKFNENYLLLVNIVVLAIL